MNQKQAIQNKIKQKWKSNQKINREVNKAVTVNPSVTIISKIWTDWHHQLDGLEKETRSNSCAYRKLTVYSRTHTRIEKSISCEWEPKKQEWLNILDKTDIKWKTVSRDEEGYYIMMKESIQLQGIAMATMYAGNIRAPK
jgi:hypothetical protein